MSAATEWVEHPEWPEPTGWFREPGTGRRRPDGDPEREYVNY